MTAKLIGIVGEEAEGLGDLLGQTGRLRRSKEGLGFFDLIIVRPKQTREGDRLVAVSSYTGTTYTFKVLHEQDS